MQNFSDRTIKLTRRHWRVTDGDGQREDIHGEGVIGLFPTLKPGAWFTYQSYCPLETPSGQMTGAFFFQDLDTGDEIEAKVPRFNLNMENQLNADIPTSRG